MLPRPLIGDEGIDYIALICSRSGAFFLQRPRQDVGIDAHIEFRNEQGKPTGAIALIQCKAGSSYISSSGKYQIKADKYHFQLWSQYTLPVIGIVYNPKTRNARWINISDYIMTNPSCIENGPYFIEAPANQLFSEETFLGFQTIIERLHMRLGSKSPQELINRFLTGNEIDKDEALAELFSEYRWTHLVCYFLHSAIRIEVNQVIIKYLIYLISFYRPNPDRFSQGMDSISQELSDFALKCIQTFDISEIIKLLLSIDPETGLERGSIGQIIAIQLTEINDITHELRQIVKNRKLDSHIRFYATGVLVEYLNHDDRKFFENLLKRERDADMIEMLIWALEYSQID